MADRERTIILEIEGWTGVQAKVPIDLLASKLRAIQRMLLNVGSALLGGGRRGVWKADIVQACSLVFVEARSGSLAIVTKLPDLPASLFPDDDIGYRALQQMSETLQAFRAHDTSALEKLFPDYGQRARIVKSALLLLPEEDADYQLSVDTPDAKVQLVADLRSYLTKVARKSIGGLSEEAIRTVSGRLYLIEVQTEQRRLGLIANNRRIPCYYPAEYEEVVRELVPGSLVEVEGRATLNERGEIKQVEEVLDARPVQLIPLYWTRVVHGNREFRLNEQIQIRVDFSDGVWIHEYEPLGILAYGQSRSESLDAFRLDFAACWDFVADEDDRNLTADAQELKRRLKDLVEDVED